MRRLCILTLIAVLLPLTLSAQPTTDTAVDVLPVLYESV